VLLADDNADLVRAITRLLSPRCDILGCAPDASSLLDAVAELAPDVVLLDFSLPGELSGLQLCRHLKATAPEVHVVAFTGSADPQLPRAAREAGASAFVWKLQASDELWPTIEALVA
jgi:CheY-like chemotaxis protein